MESPSWLRGRDRDGTSGEEAAAPLEDAAAKVEECRHGPGVVQERRIRHALSIEIGPHEPAGAGDRRERVHAA